MSTNIIVVNVTGLDMFVTGSYGSDLSNMTQGQRIPTGAAMTVASWNTGSGDDWDYVYLGTTPLGPKLYQLYMELTLTNKPYQFMGFYSDNPNNENSNPKPFTNPSCSATGVTPNGDWVYTFLTIPS